MVQVQWDLQREHCDQSRHRQRLPHANTVWSVQIRNQSDSSIKMHAILATDAGLTATGVASAATLISSAPALAEASFALAVVFLLAVDIPLNTTVRTQKKSPKISTWRPLGVIRSRTARGSVGCAGIGRLGGGHWLAGIKAAAVPLQLRKKPHGPNPRF